MDAHKIHAVLRADLQGLPDSYIQEKLDISQHVLKRLRESELYQARFSSLQEEANQAILEKVVEQDDPVSEVLHKAAMTAATRNVELLSSDNDAIVQKSAWDILDRTGHPKTTRTEGGNQTTVVVDTESMKALRDALSENSV